MTQAFCFPAHFDTQLPPSCDGATVVAASEVGANQAVHNPTIETATRLRMMDLCERT